MADDQSAADVGATGSIARREDDGGDSNGFRTFLNPIVAIATAILVSIFVLIGSAIVGFDKVLLNMSKIEFARGLITYLFAVVTIGTAVVLVVSALTSTESDAHEKRFQRGKEILSLLLGVFGTIVGFYFGSEVTQKAAGAVGLQLAPIHLNVRTVASEGQLTVETYVSGGRPPYKYGVAVGTGLVEPSETVEYTGWIQKTVAVPKMPSEQDVPVHVVVIDADSNKADQSAPVTVKPNQ
jgi:hypothetical protein